MRGNELSLQVTQTPDEDEGFGREGGRYAMEDRAELRLLMLRRTRIGDLKRRGFCEIHRCI